MNESDGAHGAELAASPSARELAQELGIDLRTVRGTGPRGRIVRSDVEGAARGRDATVAAPVGGALGAASDDRDDVIPPTRLQRAIARRMVQAKTSAPDFVLVSEVDMEAAMALRAELKVGWGADAPSLNDIIVKACALALREFPYANGSWSDDGFVLHREVNVGVAVASADALVVPVVRDADRLGLREIAARTRELAARVRAGSITQQELTDATFTVSNLGMYGIRRFTAVLNPPQAAIVAVGAAVPRMRLHDSVPAIRRVLDLSLTCDHRIVYGAAGAQFLARVRALLERPADLLDG